MSTVSLWCQRVIEGSINGNLSLLEVMAWRQQGAKILLEAMLTKMYDTIWGHYVKLAC